MVPILDLRALYKDKKKAVRNGICTYCQKEEQDEGCDVQDEDGANTDLIEGLILLKRDDDSIMHVCFIDNPREY